jgi:hypothetical protein
MAPRGPEPHFLKRQVERALRLTIGSILLLIGVIGGFIPVLQGWIFILGGLTLMAPESRQARRALDWAKRRVKRERAADGRAADDSDQKVDTDGNE